MICCCALAGTRACENCNRKAEYMFNPPNVVAVPYTPVDMPKNVKECDVKYARKFGCILFNEGRCERKDSPLKQMPEELATKEEYIKQLIRKDIPLPVYLEGDGYSDGELVYDTAICENCNAHYEIDFEHYKYCPNCGQRLDWSEVEEND